MSIAEGPRGRADGITNPAHAGEAVARAARERSEQERESQPFGPTALHQSAHALANPYCYFLDDDAFVETARPGFRHRVITGEHLQLCFWRIAGGAEGSVLHNHTENEQLGVIMRGKLDFRIGPDGSNDERIVLSEGDSYLAPRSVWHGDSVFIGDDTYGECWILDVFAPPRADLATTG